MRRHPSMIIRRREPPPDQQVVLGSSARPSSVLRKERYRIRRIQPR
jgi:hypothetical protein